MRIAVLGMGCPKCQELYDAAETAAEELKLNFVMEKVTDINKIISYGVSVTPALAVDGKVVSAGNVPSKEKIKKLLGY